MEFTAIEGVKAPLVGTTLVVPAISIGNVGQLAVDLIITGLNLSQVGFLEEPNVLPCAGNDALGRTAEGLVSTSLEVFHNPSSSITVIQQRAPHAPGRLKAFAKNLSEWVRASNFKDVIILSGLDAGKQIGGHALPQQRVRYVALPASNDTAKDKSSSSLHQCEQRCQELAWPVLEDFTPSQDEPGRASENGSQHTQLSQEASLSQRTSYGSMFGIDDAGSQQLEPGQWWGAGQAYQRTAFWKIAQALKGKSVSVLSLLLLCSEGDNVPDGIALATALDSLLKLGGGTKQGSGPSSWKIPLSWASIYGPPPDSSLFG